jgi:transposase
MPQNIDFMRVQWYNFYMETQENSVKKLTNIIEEKDRRIAELERQVEWFLSQLRLSKHKQYGASSEQTDSNQISIFNEAETTADLTQPEPEITEVKAHYRRRTRLTTDKLPEDLPIEVIEHELPKQDRDCPECGSGLHTMGKETREEIKIIPAKAIIVRHVRHIYACRNCEATSDHVPIVKADMPKAVIKGGFASPEAIAHIAVQKFMMGSPLYRQEQEWKQNGILLSRQTMANWLLKASNDWLEPLYEKMRLRLLKHSVLHVDETTVQVLKEPGRAARSKSYMWLYRTSGEAKNQIILYDYQPDRRYIRPREFLRGFSGYIHTDGYEAYHKLPGNITVVGCLAHLRRKFFDGLKILPKEKRKDSYLLKGVEYCDQLFRFEREFALLSPRERLEKRQRLSKPLFDEFYNWMEGLGALPSSMLGKAVYYARSQKKYIERYLTDGRLEISNNRAERSIKPFVIGRKNWLFSNTPAGARSSAIYYSLIITAIENGLNPFEYLTWVLTQMPNLGKPGYAASVEELLPGSTVLPEKVFAPTSKKEPKQYAWEEQQ